VLEMNAKLSVVNVPTGDVNKSRVFYTALLGSEFARSLTERVQSYHQPISEDGIQLTLTNRQRADERVTCYFAVDNLKAALEEVHKHGGKVVVEPFDMPIAERALHAYQLAIGEIHPGFRAGTNVGHAAIVIDPDGNTVGLVEFDPQMHLTYRVGNYRKPLGKDQVLQQKKSVELGKIIGD
jgi:predicted enzyme related to lactoylglutathione lyase